MRPLVLSEETPTTEAVLAELRENHQLNGDYSKWIGGAVDRYFEREATDNSMVAEVVIRRINERVSEVRFGGKRLKFALVGDRVALVPHQ